MMTHKAISNFRALAENKTVSLSGYKSTPYFQDPESKDLFKNFRVWRKEETEFRFGQDYAEFFDGLDISDATVIYEGPLELSNDRKLTFVDSDVVIGKTYTYWIAAAQGEATGPVAVKVRDPKVWWTEDKICQKMDELEKKYPDLVQSQNIGKTVEGRNITALIAGHGKKDIALIGAIHAGEAGPALMLSLIENFLAENSKLLKNISILAVPVVNLDQYQREVQGVPWYLRVNSNGVDLNRNFPADWDEIGLGYGLDTSEPDSGTYRGLFPASEPEVKAVMSFLKKQKPVTVFSYHCLAGVCGKHFLASACSIDNADYSNRCKDIVKKYSEGYARDLQEEELNDDNIGFAGSGGSLTTWCYRELNVPAFDLEFSKDIEGCQTDGTDETMLQDNQRRHTEGMRSFMKMVETELPVINK
jgi:zinc carboxypeptidase